MISDMEREQADIEQAELEAAGREYGRAHRRMMALRKAGDLTGAAKACKHGAGYPLASLAATYAKDPRAGEKGVRCSDCGSVIDEFPWGGHYVTIIHPCELPASAW